jgi:hypothetical protein
MLTRTLYRGDTPEETAKNVVAFWAADLSPGALASLGRQAVAALEASILHGIEMEARRYGKED